MPDDDILHQDDVEQVIEEVIAEVVVESSAITDAFEVGATYDQEEINNLVATVNQILAALRTANVIQIGD